MRQESRGRLDSPGQTGVEGAAERRMNHDLAQQFTWEIAGINVHLQDIRIFFAKALGISSPQWLILMALADLDQGDGVSVKVVSKMLHVDSSFVTTQSKMLEK
jgi:DNA-binding MarR family transcriptional regulator